jgi:hypothetical protein
MLHPMLFLRILLIVRQITGGKQRNGHISISTASMFGKLYNFAYSLDY